MTEEEWLTCSAPDEMLRFTFRIGSLRKSRLLVCGLCRTVWSALTHPASRESVEASEQFADGKIDVKDMEAARRRSEPRRISQQHSPAAMAASMASRYATDHEAVRCAGLALQNLLLETVPSAAEAARLQKELHAKLFRDVYGNPFRPINLDPRWLTSTVVDLARSIYEGDPRQAGGDMALPILADALMDAGCDSEELLAHCRGPGPHVRGCWVVDLILGKE